MVPGEHHRDEHAGDLVGRESRVALIVADGDQDVEHVAVALVPGRVGDPVVHDLLYQLDQPEPRFVAQPEALDRQVRVDVTQRIGALLELVVEPGEAAVELFTELLADQACRRCVDRQLGEEVEEVDLAFVAPVGDHPAHLALDRRRVPLHLLAAQGGVVQHLFSSFGIGVEHHALAEDRRHERVCRGLIEIVVAGPEEELVGFRTGQEHHVLAGELEDADVAALVADPLHQSDRVGAELFQVAVLVFATRDARNDRGGHDGIASGPSLSC